MYPWQLDSVHPLIIHFPIALLSVSVLFDFLSVVFRKESLSHAGWWCLLVGVISALTGVISGFSSDILFGHMENPFPIFETHGSTQLLATVVFTGLLIWRWTNKCQIPSESLKYIYIAIGSLATGCLFYGAHLGAQLASRF
ncbi:MAG: DUF2231 domain-containing protein [Candidatus Marinimicrobia bacterium]|jgi:uncharacterized membrane protein|nr:DUF2231 domain-containing protein [Candidatus Neomarinimicrobiota bacterium]MDP6568731.1 DUF2231 domain-containing protein [Candidatus Neomarinimicrobiota bacterium]|tara:strand:+ start:4457 stop:4879 length:423 start_codon:yes stop_codon:yes gene_type:complete